MAKNKITLNVLAGITKKMNKGIGNGSNDKALVVFNGSNIRLNKRIEELKKLKEYGIDISIAFSFISERVLDIDYIINALNPVEVYREENIFDLEYIVEDCSYIIGPNITMNTLSKVSLGIIDSFISNILWTFLYKGKKTYLDLTSVTNYLGERCKNQEISNIIESHINTLKSMGAIEMEEGKYIEKIINANKSYHVEKENKGDNNFNRDDKKINKVITERDLINQFTANKPITLPKGTIVTPLARDKARDLGIKIEIER